MGISMLPALLLLFLTGVVDALRGHQELEAEQNSSVWPWSKCRTSKCSGKEVWVRGDLSEKVPLKNCRVTENEPFTLMGKEREESTMCEETCDVTLNTAQNVTEVRVMRKSGKGAQSCQLRGNNKDLCQEACCASKCNEGKYELKAVKRGMYYFNGCKVVRQEPNRRGLKYPYARPARCAEICQVRDGEGYLEVTALRESQVPNPSCELSVFNYPVEEIGMWFIEQIETTALKLVVQSRQKDLPLLDGDTVQAFLEKIGPATVAEFKKHGFSREITAEHVVMIGDLYGQLFTLIAFLNEIKEHYADKGFKTLDESSFLFCDPSIQYVFLGDYVNWGESSVEVLLLLLAYKARCPQSLILLQGDAEGQSEWGDVFAKELKYKGHLNQADYLKRLVRNLPFVAVAPEKFMAMHGGLTPRFETKCQNKAGRFDECLDRSTGEETFFPEPVNKTRGWKKSGTRGVYNFGMDIAAGFLKSNGLSKIFRGHEREFSGFYELKEGEYSVITLFSATDPMVSYCPSKSPSWMVDVTDIALPKPNEGAIAFIHSTDSNLTWTPLTMSLLTAKIKADQITGATCDHSYHGDRKFRLGGLEVIARG